MRRSFLTALFSLCLCVSAAAQERPANMPGLSDIRAFAENAKRDLEQAREDLSVEDMQEIYDVFMEEFADYIITSMESVPVKYWQYLVPYFYYADGFPLKVLEYPKFIPYKGAKPKDIDPKMQAFADKHLDYLHPLLYVVLMPEEASSDSREQMDDKEFKAYIRSFPQEHEARLPDAPPPRSQVIANISETVPFGHYASGKYLEDKPDISRSKAITDQAGLKGGDVLAFVATVREAVKIAEEDLQARKARKLTKEEFIQRLRQVEHQDTSAAPCRLFVEGLEEGNRTRLDAAVRAQGFSTGDWTAVCDRTIKAVRLAKLNLPLAAGIADIARSKRRLLADPSLSDGAKALIKSQMSAAENLYGGKIADVAAARDHMQEILDTFGDTNFLQFLQTSL